MCEQSIAGETITRTVNVLVQGYDAAHWLESYTMVAEAVGASLAEFVHEDDVAEEAILCEAIEKAGAATKAIHEALDRAGVPREVPDGPVDMQRLGIEARVMDLV